METQSNKPGAFRLHIVLAAVAVALLAAVVTFRWGPVERSARDQALSTKSESSELRNADSGQAKASKNGISPRRYQSSITGLPVEGSQVIKRGSQAGQFLRSDLSNFLKRRRTNGKELGFAVDPNVERTFLDSRAPAEHRNAALTKLVRSKSPRTFDLIVSVFETDSGYAGVATPVDALAASGDPRTGSYLAQLLKTSSNVELRRISAAKLGNYMSTEVVYAAVVYSARHDADASVRLNAVRSLSRSKKGRAILEGIRETEPNAKVKALVTSLLTATR